MAAPTWQSTTVTDFGADATTHAANMPATVNSGDLLLAEACFDSSTTTITTPGGWTKLIGASNSDPVGGVYAKVADGTEDSTTVDFATSNSQRGSVHVQRITGWVGSLGNITTAFATATGGIAVGFGGTGKDVLFIAAQIKSSVTAWGGSPPSGYSNENKTGTGEDTSASGSIASATKAATSVTAESVATLWNTTTSVTFGSFLVAVPAT